MHCFIDDPIIRDIPEFPNYQISEFGEVYNKITGKKLINVIGATGYYIITLCSSEGRKTKKIHKILSDIFISNPNNYTEVDHINQIKTDNRLSNLRFVSKSQNMTNINKQKNNTSGYRCIYRYNSHKKNYWRCKITKNSKQYTKTFSYNNIGLQEAISWMNNAKKIYHKIE